MSCIRGTSFSSATAAILLLPSFQGARAVDCNDNSLEDSTELGWLSPDCNSNGIPDECDVAPHPRFEAPEKDLGGRSADSPIVAWADLDRDGDLDIAGAFHGIHLYWNSGDGTFSRVTDPSEVDNVRSVLAGDLDGDGDQDLVALYGLEFQGPGVVTILFQGPEGAFSDRVDLPTGELNYGVLALGDLDADGLQDVVIGHYVPDGEDIVVLFSSGSGMFGPALLLETGHNPRQIISADLDGDQLQDLAVTSETGVNVLWNEGHRAFALSAVLPTSYDGPVAVHAADLDGDSAPDLAVGHLGGPKTSGGISLLRNAGGRALTEVEEAFPSLIGAFESISGADLDGDGDVDVAAGSSGDLTVLLNAGDGSFEDWMSYGVETGSIVSVFCADVDADGDEDVAAGGPIYFRNRGNGTFPGEMRLQWFGSPHVAPDLDGDGDADVVTQAAVLANSGGGTFRETASLFDLEIAPVAAGDLDGDLDADVVATRRGDVVILTNAGGDLGPPLAIGSGPDPVWAAAGDLDADGDLDVAVAYYSGNTVDVIENLGAGAFSPLRTIDVEPHPQHVAIGDLDGDGLSDLVSANGGATLLHDDDSISLVLQRGVEGFGPARTLEMRGGPYHVALADLDGDADIDIATTMWFGDALSVLLNPGDGSFEEPVDYPSHASPVDIVAVDLEGDGDLDLASSHYSDSQLSWLRNDGSGVFGELSRSRRGQGAMCVTAADLDADGDPDLVTSGYFLSFLWNITGLPASQDCDRNDVPDECEPAPCARSLFVRGDANDSGAVDISDAVFTLDYLFIGSKRPSCLAALDANFDRQVNITDALYTLQFLFLGSLRIPPPYPACGTDDAPLDLSCVMHEHCS